MTDQMPKPTGLSKPSVGSDDFFNQDFSKFGQPEKNLEVGGGDLAVGLAGSALRGTGTGIAEIGLSDLVRAGSALSDKLPGTQVLEYARRKLMGESEEEQAAKKADALDKITGAVTDPIDNTIIKPIVNPIGTAIKEGGETLIDRGTSEDYKEALRGREIFTGNGVSDFGISDSAGDPAVWAAKFTDGIGSLGGTLAVGALTGGTVKALVKKQMLKRGASMELADETARLAGIKWGQRGAMAEGVNMSTGQSADQARSQVESLSWDQLLTSKTFNDQVKEISRDPQFEGATATDLLNEARRRTADYAASIAKSDPKTWAAAAAGTLLGDAALFKMLQGTGAKGLAAGALQGMAGEGLGETVEEGTQQYIGNEATNIAGGQNIDPMRGVMQAAATAGTIGALSGGGVGAIGGARGSMAPQDEQSAIGGEQPSDPQESLQASAVPEFDSALAEVNAIERKTYGQHSIGRDGNKFRGAYVDELGNVQITPAYSKIEDVRAAMGWPVHGQTDNAASSPAGGDEFANVPAFQRQDGGRFKGWAADSDVQRALSGEFGSSVQEIIAAQMQAGDQGKTMQERVLAGELGHDPFAGGKSAMQVGMDNAPLALPQKDIIYAGDANAKQPGTEVAPPGAFDDKQAGPGPQFRGAERTRWQDGQEGDVLPPESAGNPAGALPGRVIEGEAREVGTELPYKPFIAGQDNRAAVSEEQRRQAEQSAMAERQQNQPKQIGQSDTIFAPGAPGADNKNSAYTPPRLSRDQVDNTLGEQSTRDPRSPVAQAIEQAGSEQDSIFGQLKTLRITKRGKPFASQKEAQLASRKTETPIALPTGGFGVVDKAELEQVQASQAPVKQPLDMPSATVSQEPTASVINEGTSQQPSRQGREVTAPVQAEASQVNHDSNEVPGSDVGNGFKAGPYKGAKYRVSTTNITGAENGTPILEKRMPSGSVYTLYVGTDGNLLDSNNVVFNDQSSKERVWRPASKEQTAEAASILDEMGKLDLNDPKRAELKVKLKALVLGETTSTIKPSMQAAASIPRATDYPDAKSYRQAMLEYYNQNPRSERPVNTIAENVSKLDRKIENAEKRLQEQLRKQAKPGLMPPAIIQNAIDNIRDEIKSLRAERKSIVGSIADNQNKSASTTGQSAQQMPAGPRFTIEPLTDKSIIVKGDKNDAELKGRVEAAWPKAKPLYNERHKGWVFSSKREGVVREALADLVHGDVAEQKAPSAEDVSLKESPAAVQKKTVMTNKLRDTGKTLINLGRDKANQPRLSNTPKRASQAASAIRDAENMQTDGETLLKIADAVDNGEAPHLSRLSSKAQYQTLDQLHRRAIPNKHMDGGEYRGYYEGRTEQRRKSGVTVDDYADQIQYPTISVHPDHLRTAASTLSEIRGYKGLADKLNYAARLVTNSDRYQPAVLNEETAKALIKAAKDTGNRDVKWASEHVESGMSTIDRLRRMGIDNRDQLVEAIKELDAIQVPRKKENRLQQLERGLVGNKIPGYFNTQGEALKRVMEAADVKPGETVLEPSAGKGNIADAAKDAGAEVDTVERHYTLREILQEKGHNLVGDDFTALDASKQYDKVIMNPPFEQQQDIDHVRKAWAHIKPGGRLVAVMSAGVESNSNRKATEFRQWLDDNGGTMDRLPEGSFKDSDRSTGVNTVMVVMDKPISKEANKPASTGLRGTPQGVVTKESIARYQADEAQKAADNRRREQEAVGTDYPELNELVAVYSKPSPSVTETRKAAESRVKVSNAIKAAKGLDESYRFDKLIDSNWQSDREQAIALAKEVYSGTKKAAGNKVTVHTPGGKPVNVQYRLAEAGDLMASHDFDGSVNPLFPQELQPRDRSRAAARQQLFNIAQQPAPDRLAASAETDRGAPITKDGVVESGNGRVIGLTEAYRRGNATTYRQYLADHASDFGFTKEQIQGMKQPILVRERLTDMSADERRAFTVDSNKGASLSLGATEQAMADANGMDDAMLAKLMIGEGGDVLAASNEAFLNDFATMLGNNELGTYKTQTGEWTSAYRQRVMNAIFAKGYGNSDLLSNIAESANPEVRNLLNGLMNNAGKVATLRGIDAESGARLASVYSEAANLIGKSRRDKQSIQELNSQGDMLGGGASQEAKELAAFIDNNMRSGKSISSILGNIANKLIESAKNRHQADIFSGETNQSVTVGEAIHDEVAERNANQAKQPKPGNDLFGANPARLNTKESTSMEGTTARSAGGIGSGVSKQGVATQESAKIADFGEKIGGARKDVWTSYRDSIEGNTAEQIAELPLSKAWPAPDYQNLIDSGVDARAVGLMRAARDVIPSKPRAGYKVKSWASAVKELRDLSMGLLDGSLDADVVGRMMERSSLRSANNIINKAELYQAVGHQRSLADLTLGAGSYSIFNGVRYNPAKTIWDISRDSKSSAFGNWPHMIATGDTKEQVIAEFKKRYDQLTSEQTKPKAISFDIYSNDRRASWVVGKKVGRNYIPLSEPFKELSAARSYREENYDALVAELEKRKAIPNERRDINNPRVGEDMRSGADVTPEMFSNAFGFRGVEFGNWVEGSRRQRDLNDAYDALMDMAAVLSIHPKAISLNGQLGLAFGARGSGGVSPAAAHYEPGKVVINLTKMNGAGSLGHEWWHALDNYFGRMRGDSGSMSDARDVGLAARGSNYFHQGAVRKEMVDAFGAVKRAIDQTAIKARSSKLDGKRSKEYWTTDKEMSARAFESYLISKLQDQGVSNDYLANIASEETWDAMASLGFELDESYPYPTAGEIPAIRAGFDHLFDTIEQKEDGDRVALFSLSDAAPNARGMTKPELEMVATDWSKQYKGAASARIMVAANQAEMNEVLGMVGAAMPDGQTINAAYLPGYKTLLLNAEAIQSPKRARELMRHELLAHHGLREVVGDDAYISIIEAVKRGKDISGIKDAYYQVAENYTDMHPDVQAEEVFAHWMEQQPDRGELAVWWRGIVRRVKDALRAVGLVGERTTEEEFNRVLDAITTGMRNGRQPGRRVMESWHEAPAYSKGADDVFTPDRFDAKQFADDVEFASKNPSARHEISMGDTPHVLRRLGLDGIEMVMPASVVRKATDPNVRGHHVPLDVLKSLPSHLSDPVAVMRSRTERNAFVSLIEATDKNGDPVIVAIHGNAKGESRIEVNKIASVYGKENTNALQSQLDSGLVYVDKTRAAKWLPTVRLQLPEAGAFQSSGSNKSVLTKDDIRNSGALFSLGNHSADSSILGQAESLAKAAPGSVLNWMKEQRGLGLGTLTDLQIDQIYRDVTGGAVSRYQKLRTKMEADRNDILLDAETRIDPLWDALGSEQKKALSNLMHDATMAKLHPDLSLADNSLYQEAKERLDKAVKPETKARYQSELDTIAANHKHLAERYNLGLNKEGKALYQTMRETYDKQWADLRDAIEQRLEDMMGAEGKTLAAELRLQMEHALKHGPYFPLARFGDYVVKASKGDEHIREHFERRKDAEQAIKQYQRDGYNAVMTVKEEGNGGQANSNALGMKVMQLLDKAGESGASASAIKDDVWQAMLQMLPDASFAKHAIHRRRVKGASRDGHRAYLNSVYHYAHHVSKIRYGHKMQAELNKMNEQIQSGVRGEASDIKPGDLEVAQQVLNEMNKRHELNMNPKGAKWTGWAGNLGFMWYMAGSPASAIINMTQNFTVMLPQLGAKYGFVKASAAMAKALHDYAKHGKFKAGTKEAWVSLTRADSGITRDEKELLNSLYKAGALDLTQAHSVAARADTDLQDVKPGAAWKRKTMAWLGSMFHNAEVLNREVAALAAYRLLKSADPSLSPEQYADKVTEMVYDGHGNYAASNRPRYMRGDVAKVLTQFKIYSQMMTYTIYRNAYLAAKGDKVALKTLGGVLGTHFIMAGVMGLPFPITAALYAIAAAADDDDDRTGEASFRLGLAETLGADLGELVARGPMDAVTGLSIAGRTGINDLWFREPKEGAEGDDLAWHVTQQIAGPVLGIGVQAARGLSMMSDGDYQRGAEAMMPKALKDLAKSYRQASDGEQTRKGDVIIDDVSAFNVAMQAMGFGNAEMAKAYDAREYIKGKEGRIEDERSKLMSDYFMARKDGDDEAMADVMARIREFNSSHYRTEAITSRTLRQSLKSKQRSAHRTQGGVYLSRNREYLRGEGAFIGDGGTATN